MNGSHFQLRVDGAAKNLVRAKEESGIVGHHRIQSIGPGGVAAFGGGILCNLLAFNEIHFKGVAQLQ